MTRTLVFDLLTLEADPVLGGMAEALKHMAVLQYNNRLEMPYILAAHRGSRYTSPYYEARVLALWVNHGWLYAEDRRLGHGKSPEAAKAHGGLARFGAAGLPEYRQPFAGLGYRGILSGALRYALRHMDWIWSDRPELMDEAETALALGELS